MFGSASVSNQLATVLCVLTFIPTEMWDIDKLVPGRKTTVSASPPDFQASFCPSFHFSSTPCVGGFFLAKGYSYGPSSVVRNSGPTVATVCLTKNFWMIPGVNEVLEHDCVFAPSSDELWDGAKATVRLSFTPIFSVESMRALLVSRHPGYVNGRSCRCCDFATAAGTAVPQSIYIYIYLVWFHH